jgi:hypothetical protein
MAKVRIQAGQERVEKNELPISNAEMKSPNETERGALDILGDVYNERGMRGWYQVSCHLSLML